MESKKYLKSNFCILYEELKKAANKYTENTCDTEALMRVEAFLIATIHALVDYADRFMDKDSEEILACKYVNNASKHLHGFVTLKSVTGGITFPMSFPFSSEPIAIRWTPSDLTVKDDRQNEAYKKCFVGKEIFETLTPIADKIMQQLP